MAITAVDLRAERLADPLGITEPRPALSWRLQAEGEADVAQVAWRVQVAVEPGFASPEADTGWVEGWQSLDRPWPAAPLASRERRWWRVAVRTSCGGGVPVESGWSGPAWVEAGLLSVEDWQARFVGAPAPAAEDADRGQPANLLRSTLEVPGAVASARLHVTALGVVEPEVNGVAVSADVLTPGWTSYAKRLLYRTYDVTELVHPGENVLGASVADGWYRGFLGWSRERCFYGDRTALLAQLEVVTTDGRRHVLATDPTWRWSTAEITSTDLYDGERVDLALAQPGWSSPGFDDGAWALAEPVEHDLATLTTNGSPPIRRTGEVAPVSIVEREGAFVVDFGQNLVGRVRIRVDLPAGRTLTLRHAEILDVDGSLRTDLLRLAQCTDTITSAGEPCWYEPRFTFHGFRYAEVSGVDTLTADDLVAVVVHNDMARRGTFTCSDPLVDKLHQNVVWGQRGNFLGVPTDCPQRDERLGWTGDAQVFGPTAAFVYDAGPFLAGWLQDVAADQREDGAVPHVVPTVVDSLVPWGSCGWGDVASLMPWDLYVADADEAVLARQYPSMRAWVEFALGRAGDDLLWTGDFHFGDWLDPDAPPDKPWHAKARMELVATAYLVRSLDALTRTAALLGHGEDAARYGEIATRTRAAFWAEFGGSVGDSQTGCALALSLDLVPTAEERTAVADRLVALVREAGDHLATGFLGTPVLCPALSDNGHADVAYDVLLQQTPPGWLYPVLQGATTIWERWDALRPDGTVPADPLGGGGTSMVSFNHYAYGAVAAWLHTTVAGLAPDAADPGYHHVVVRPVPGGGLTSAAASIDARYGPTSVSWEVVDGTFHLSVAVPPNTTASVWLPGTADPVVVGSGAHAFTS